MNTIRRDRLLRRAAINKKEQTPRSVFMRIRREATETEKHIWKKRETIFLSTLGRGLNLQWQYYALSSMDVTICILQVYPATSNKGPYFNSVSHKGPMNIFRCDNLI